MAKEKSSFYRDLLDQLVSVLQRLPWIDILSDLWILSQKLRQGMAVEGMYEVLEYASTLELLDKKGKRAIFRKRQKVRYLQDNVIAYQDQAWGDGDILRNYRCTPGTDVDRYRTGHKTYILISLREVKSRGDVDEFNIEWEIRRGFLRQREQWETDIDHRTKLMRIQVIFPRSRPPLRLWLIERVGRRSQLLDPGTLTKRTDGRWLASWETDRPRLHERYILQWEW